MRRIVDNDWLTMALRLFVGIAFIYASWYKIIEPATFGRSIFYYQMVSGEYINLMAIILPWLELICGVLLIVGVYFRGSLLLIAAMTVVFMIALTTAGLKGIDIDCGCFKAGKKSTNSAWNALWFDLVLMVAIGQLWITRSRRWRLGS